MAKVVKTKYGKISFTALFLLSILACFYPANHPEVFILGDGASTPLSGMAQTALQDGAFAAEAIVAKSMGLPEPSYTPKAPAYAVPVGPKWAAVMIGKRRYYGIMGWFYRRLFDFRIFRNILPFGKAVACLRAGTQHIDRMIVS